MTPTEEAVHERLEILERRFLESAEEIRTLRSRLMVETKAELSEIKDQWHGVHTKWWAITLSGVLVFFVLSYALYTQLGWAADQRHLPTGSDWLLKRTPVVNTLPILSWGWLGLHLVLGGAAIAYYPRRIPFLMFLLGVYVFIRTLFVFLSPIGPPAGMMDMSKLDFLFSRIMGTWTFNNEFVFSGHTGIPFLFYLFFETPRLKAVCLAGSIVMGVSVLLSRNHYTVDVLGAYLVSYSIFKLSEHLYYRYIRPVFMTRPTSFRF
ncbi:MAG: phosphatase PAP2 family protein [Elusimicrobia bacterium]|nr:phosphatase PAP2 family protein [Elusimicrobiota bacterium]